MKRIACLLLVLLTVTPFAGAEFIFTDGTVDETPPAAVEADVPQLNTLPEDGVPVEPLVTPPPANDDWPRKIVISVGGDCTLGTTDAQRANPEGFDSVVKEKGFAWPFSELAQVFGQDDLTLVNFEGTLTESNNKTEGKLFNFKGPAEYAEMLVLGSVEAVNLANNHFIDYGDQGKADTKAALDAYNITHCGTGETAIYETRGVKIGLIGNTFPYKDGKRDISKAVSELRDVGCQIVVASFHWGTEYEPYTRDQKNIGRAAIKAGADVIIGHHPHIIQPIEKYEDTYILYSLGNLVFGGNTDPEKNRRDTYIAQLTFTVYENGTVEGPELKIIPMRLTEQSKGTDYRPVFATGDEYDRILKSILNSSINMEGFVNPQ